MKTQSELKVGEAPDVDIRELLLNDAARPEILSHIGPSIEMSLARVRGGLIIVLEDTHTGKVISTTSVKALLLSSLEAGHLVENALDNLEPKDALLTVEEELEYLTSQVRCRREVVGTPEEDMFPVEGDRPAWVEDSIRQDLDLVESLN